MRLRINSWRYNGRASQFFGFVEQLTLFIRTFTAGTKLLMFVVAKLFFVPRQLLLQLDVFQLKGFDVVDVRRGRRIHAGDYTIHGQSSVLQQVMAITFIKPWTDTAKAGALSFVRSADHPAARPVHGASE